MPRNISFSLTEPQFLDGTKDVTRRMGWKSLQAGVELVAVVWTQVTNALGDTIRATGSGNTFELID